jgi:hypothetical protein
MMANKKYEEEKRSIECEKKVIKEGHQFLMNQVVRLEQQLVKSNKKYQEAKKSFAMLGKLLCCRNKLLSFRQQQR